MQSHSRGKSHTGTEALRPYLSEIHPSVPCKLVHRAPEINCHLLLLWYGHWHLNNQKHNKNICIKCVPHRNVTILRWYNLIITHCIIILMNAILNIVYVTTSNQNISTIWKTHWEAQRLKYIWKKNVLQNIMKHGRLRPSSYGHKGPSLFNFLSTYPECLRVTPWPWSKILFPFIQYRHTKNSLCSHHLCLYHPCSHSSFCSSLGLRGSASQRSLDPGGTH